MNTLFEYPITPEQCAVHFPEESAARDKREEAQPLIEITTSNKSGLKTVEGLRIGICHVGKSLSGFTTRSFLITTPAARLKFEKPMPASRKGFKAEVARAIGMWLNQTRLDTNHPFHLAATEYLRNL